MSEQLIHALQEAKSPAWAVRVDQWTPDGVDGTYYRLIDGPRLKVQVETDLHLIVYPQIHQSTQPSEVSGITVQDVDDDGTTTALIDDLSPAQARAFAVALVNAAEMLEQWTEASA
jgi:hypothetical protein